MAATDVLSKVPLGVTNHPFEIHIGKYVKFKGKDNGSFKDGGAIFEIVAIQKHWGYINGEYLPNKIGFRLSDVGNPNSFGCVGDIDEVEFVNISEADASLFNKNLTEEICKSYAEKFGS